MYVYVEMLMYTHISTYPRVQVHTRVFIASMCAGAYTRLHFIFHSHRCASLSLFPFLLVTVNMTISVTFTSALNVISIYYHEYFCFFY